MLIEILALNQSRTRASRCTRYLYCNFSVINKNSPCSTFTSYIQYECGKMVVAGSLPVRMSFHLINLLHRLIGFRISWGKKRNVSCVITCVVRAGWVIYGELCFSTHSQAPADVVLLSIT